MERSRWGALPSDWDAFLPLFGPDIWPCVCDPSILTRQSPTEVGGEPVGKRFSKVPSAITEDGEAFKFGGWTRLKTLDWQHKVWSQDRRLGFGVVGRTVKGIDIDIDDPERAAEVADFIGEFFDDLLPERRRAGSGHIMALYRLAGAEAVRRKHVVRTEYGAIEFLFDRQFLVLAGVHHSGTRQQWPDGIPSSLEDIPSIDDARLTELIEALHGEYGIEDAPDRTGYNVITPDHRRAEDADEDEVARVMVTLEGQGLFRGELPDGKIAVKCPWQAQHKSTGGGDDPDLTKTVLFPPGVGGFTRWGFKCAHTEGHGNKTWDEFAEFAGIVPAEFDVVEDASDDAMTRPVFRDAKAGGRVPDLIINMVLALRWKGLGFRPQFDTFKWTPQVYRDDARDPIPLTDEHYAEVSMRMHDRVNLRTKALVNVRAAVALVAKENSRDVAREWAAGLRWDGVDRFSRFHADVLGCEDSAYAQAVVRYMFTAMAGRLIDAPIKADMVPVFVGPQGIRKSTAVKALAPWPEAFVTIDLSQRDTDLSRLLRGRLVVESGELRGRSSRDQESLKDWLVKTVETWVPKFKEFGTEFPRRFILIGTTNTVRFLNDPSGSRRWLPLKVGVTRPIIDTDFIQENCWQLWAQAIHEYNKNKETGEPGIEFEKAEFLASEQASKFTRIAPAETRVRDWLKSIDFDGFTTEYLIRQAFGQYALSRAGLTIEIENALLSLGYQQDDLGAWHLRFL